LLPGNAKCVDLQKDLNALGIVFQITMGSGNPASISKLKNIIQRQT
jgi:hypothetical protein